MAGPADFDPIARALRDAIVEHFDARGHLLDDLAGRRTLDTNSMLAFRRADMLIQVFLARSGHRSLEGVRAADLGCGFGALALAFAARGAQVVAVDPNVERVAVGESVARAFGLDVSFSAGTLEDPGLEPGSVTVVFINNALCYVVPRARRRRALRGVNDMLAPGGWVVLRDPNRAHPRDPFTHIPLVHRFPPAVTRGVLRLVRVHRSRVRLTTPRAAVRDLRAARFVEARYDGAGGPRRARDRFAGYHHVSARKARMS